MIPAPPAVPTFTTSIHHQHHRHQHEHGHQQRLQHAYLLRAVLGLGRSPKSITVHNLVFLIAQFTCRAILVGKYVEPTSVLHPAFRRFEERAMRVFATPMTPRIGPAALVTNVGLEWWRRRWRRRRSPCQSFTLRNSPAGSVGSLGSPGPHTFPLTLLLTLICSNIPSTIRSNGTPPLTPS